MMSYCVLLGGVLQQQDHLWPGGIPPQGNLCYTWWSLSECGQSHWWGEVMREIEAARHCRINNYIKLNYKSMPKIRYVQWINWYLKSGMLPQITSFTLFEWIIYV